jgi:transcription antitermination factor NusG
MHITLTPSSRPVHGYYTVKVRSRAEISVSASLREKGFDVLLPTFRSVRQYSDRIRKVDSAVFPGYVFVAMDIADLYRVSITSGVDYIVKVCNSLQPLPGTEVALLQALSGMQSGYEPCEPYALGERVRIESGPLRGQTGVLVRNVRRDRVVLSLNSIFSSVSIDLRDTIVRPCTSTSKSTMPAYQELRSGWASMPSEAA